MKLLVVDDDPIVRAMVTRLARPSVDRVIEADNGIDGLSAIERDDPDLLVTDLRMPALDGFELIATIRRSERHRDMPIICLSAVNHGEDIRRLAAMGITEYLLKPLVPSVLAERLRDVVRARGSWKDAREGGAVATVARTSVLVIDGDAEFRARVRGAVAPRFDVVEASSGADGLRQFRTRCASLAAVVVAEGLPSLDERRVATMMHQVAANAGASPAVILLAAGEVAESNVGSPFAGVVRRSLAAEELRAALAPWLPALRDAGVPADA